MAGADKRRPNAGGALSEELAALDGLAASGRVVAARCQGSITGHMLEAHFPAGIALAALAVSKGRFYPPFDPGGVEAACDAAADEVIVTAIGHWRGEAAASVARADRS